MTTHTTAQGNDASSTDAADADKALKAKHRTMWGLGDYPAVATEVIASLGPVLVEACGVGPSDTVLDVGAGSGNVAIPAARTGATVTASDLTPALLENGRLAAQAEGVTLEWEEGDAEHLPYDADAFDVVLSCVGVMFAPHHQESADEIVRVTRQGGRIGLLSWTPQGFIGQMFATMKPYAPPPPPGAQPPPLWGDEEHVRALLGDRVRDVTATRQTLVVDRFSSGEEFRDFFKATYGPTIAVYAAIADEPGRVATLDAELAELGRRYGADTGRMEWEYLLLTARKA
ncbi:class I SAM-dependent methyltransferase [Mumia zhuanghuii]|uniref:Class I SAM-dependent methyltransferase n=2 Tax=Mumia TaxID=1546255 RepID=A0ABW1QKA3_9ACTN|nr:MULTISPECIES: class I SAM-dependent methyltransferase [Mumia]KAA1418333.1 class I SAM-dependent methyltransferase [Mumia zhuanghuii]